MKLKKIQKKRVSKITNNIETMIGKRMNRIGKIKTFNNESLYAEKKESNHLVSVSELHQGGSRRLELKSFPEDISKLTKNNSLKLEEFIDIMNLIVDEEEEEWDTLKVSDVIIMLNEKLIEKSIEMYAENELNIDLKEFAGKAVEYIPHKDEDGNYLGNIVLISYTKL